MALFDQNATKLGFKSQDEMNRMIALVPPNHYSDYIKWQDNDSTKSGLIQLLLRVNGKVPKEFTK